MVESPADPVAASNQRQWRYRDCALIACLCLVLYLAGNGQISLWDRDEPWYAQATREMVESGNFIVPTFNGRPRLQKPVLIYWLMALGYTLFGDNEFGARFASAISGTVTCLLTYRLGTRMAGRSVGLVASLMLAVSPGMLIVSKTATTDAVLTAILLGAISCLWELHREGFSRPWSLGLWVLLGLATLTKGPLGPAMVAASLLAWLLLSRQWGILRKLNWAQGAITFAAVVLPWGLAVYWATGGEFYRVAIGKEAVGHSLRTMEDHRGFPGYYLATALLGLFPWSFALSLAFRGLRTQVRQDGPCSFLLGWTLGPLVLLELMRSKLPHYYLLAYPAWAIMIARGLVESRAAGEFVAQTARGRIRIAALAAISVGAALTSGTLAITWGPPELRPPALMVSAVLAAGTTGAVILLLRKQDGLGWGTLVGTWGLMGLVAAIWLLPCAEACRVEHAAAQELRAHMDDSATVVLHAYREPSLVYYLRRPVPVISSSARLCRFVHDRGPALTLVRARELEELEKSDAIRVEICRRFQARRIGPIRAPTVVLARLSRPGSSDGVTAAAGKPDSRQ